jgi:hypothetical protein
MRSMARALSGEATKRMPVPDGAQKMLDIGGSHGYYSVALCRRHEGLRAVVLDLPEAVKQAGPLSPRREWATASFTARATHSATTWARANTTS